MRLSDENNKKASVSDSWAFLSPLATAIQKIADALAPMFIKLDGFDYNIAFQDARYRLRAFCC